jgi:hypothetical protein
MIGVISQALTYVVPFLLVLTLVVTVHELGHFLTARAFGVKMDRFSIGFGRAIFRRTDKHGVEWRIGWLPLGGYVKFSGDLDATGVPDRAGLEALRQAVTAEHGRAPSATTSISSLCGSAPWSWRADRSPTSSWPSSSSPCCSAWWASSCVPRG